MRITTKDKKLLLLIASFLIIFWFLFLSISSLSARIFFRDSDINKLFLGDNHQWLNVSRDLTAKDLENRIVLLDFWTYACVNCLHMIPEIKKLEEQFGDKLTVIGVHSGKFSEEKGLDNVKSAVLKYEIDHPVINDGGFAIWKNFTVSSWPTLVLINPKGEVQKVYVGEGNGVALSRDIKKLVKKYQPQLNKTPLPVLLEKNKVAGHILQFPSKIEFARNFSYKNITKTNALIIADSKNNRIVVIRLDGKIILEVGSGKRGLKDGDIDSAQFNFPRGLLYKDNILYVADTGNHALRKVDFKNNQVSTLVGSGERGFAINDEVSAISAELASPWDLEFFPDYQNIIIANAGTHQLLKYNIGGNVITPFAGSGVEDIIDGKYPNNALAQTGGLSVVGGKLYFVDSESSSLRVADKSGEVKTLIGKGLFDFGYKNGGADTALMQHPVGLVADDTGVYIADTLNNVIRKYNFSTKQISDYGNGKSKVSYNEPEDIIAVLDKFYIADTNNNRIVVVDRKSNKASVLALIPVLKMPKDGLLEYLPNLQKIPTIQVASGVGLNLLFDLKKGWKINEQAPSFFNLVEIKRNKSATLIATYDWSIIEKGAVRLPKLSSNRQYYLQGTVYYCEDKANAICLIRSYQQKLQPKKGAVDNIRIEFIY